MSEVTDAFSAWLAEPTAERFTTLRTAVAKQPDYAPYSDRRGHITELLQAGQYPQAYDELQSSLLSWFLNPSMHLLAASVYEKGGKGELAEAERQAAAAIMDGILSTGDGTRERPYRVLYVADEYDVLSVSAKKPAIQSLSSGPTGPCDRIDCEDGSTLWFDIAVPLATLARQVPGTPSVAAPEKRWWEFWK
jgi:hypothetical protein